MRYGFIGLGNLGAHLAASLVRAGFDVHVHDLNRAAADQLVAAGATWAASPADAAKGCRRGLHLPAVAQGRDRRGLRSPAALSRGSATVGLGSR